MSQSHGHYWGLDVQNPVRVPSLVHLCACGWQVRQRAIGKVGTQRPLVKEHRIVPLKRTWKSQADIEIVHIFFLGLSSMKSQVPMKVEGHQVKCRNHVLGVLTLKILSI